MDKETLSHYGWIIICVIIIAALLSTAFIVARVVTDKTKSTVDRFFDNEESSVTAFTTQENRLSENNLYFS